MNLEQIDKSLRSFANEQPIPVTVSGDCMAPLFSDGACLHISPEKMYWPGDIIVFRRWDRQLVSHRLLAYYRRHGEKRYLTQPDSGSRPDSAITVDQILGKVVGGACLKEAVNIPLRQRLMSVIRMCKVMLVRIPAYLNRLYR